MQVTFATIVNPMTLAAQQAAVNLTNHKGLWIVFSAKAKAFFKKSIRAFLPIFFTHAFFYSRRVQRQYVAPNVPGQVRFFFGTSCVGLFREGFVLAGAWSKAAGVFKIPSE